jgi:hypothetical protein
MGQSAAGVARQVPANEVDFALIGHQESWGAAADVLAVLRGPKHPPLPDDEVKDIVPWIPPRAICHVEVKSKPGATARGVYIDSFIPPDRLEATYTHDNVARVRGAAAYAIRAGAKIVSLGGFSSILIEGKFDQLPERQGTVFTTGNTLTVGFIVQGIRKMCALEGRNLTRSTLLIVGATGDVGSGCARCLAPLVRRVLLNARNEERLQKAGVGAGGRWNSGRDLDGAAAILRRGGRRGLCGESGIFFASVGPSRARRNHLRRGIPEKPLSNRADAGRQNLLWRAGTNHWRLKVRAGFSRNSKPPSFPRCRTWLSA